MRQQTYLENAIEQLKESPVEVCVIWPFSKTSNGYAQTTYDGQLFLVHRLAYQLYYDQEPQNLILHKCGNKSCYNPEHLYDGTYSQNAKDVVRHRGMFPAGQRKLTESDVIQILEFLRYGNLTHQQIADCYGVSRSVISAINTNRTWKHVPREHDKVFIEKDHTAQEAIILQVSGKPKVAKRRLPKKSSEVNISEKEINIAKGLLARGFNLTEVASWLDIPRAKVRVLSNEST